MPSVWAHVKRCVKRSCTCLVQEGQSGDGLCEALTLCIVEGMVIYLFCVEQVQHRVSDASDVLTSGYVTFISVFIFLVYV